MTTATPPSPLPSPPRAPREPHTELQAEYGTPDATATTWATGSALLAEAQMYWLASVQRNGQPHIAPLFAVWLDNAWCFCTGVGEQKEVNLRHNSRVTILTGTNLVEGIDVVVQGQVQRVTDQELLHRIAAEYVRKYDWHYTVNADGFGGGSDGTTRVQVFAVAPVKGHAFGKGTTFSQTRWTFPPLNGDAA